MEGNEWSCRANDVMNLKLVTSKQDLDNPELIFHPQFTHQFSWRKKEKEEKSEKSEKNEKEDENDEKQEIIEGYKDLQINFYFVASSLRSYLGVSYKESKVQGEQIYSTIREKYPDVEIQRNLNQFSTIIEEEMLKFKPPGILVHSYVLNQEDGRTAYEIYKSSFEDQKTKEYHKRIQLFVLFFIDGSSFIDDADERWELYFLFKKTLQNGDPIYHSVGYITVYRFFNYPDKFRKRISQVLILPPYQRAGHASALLNTIYNNSKEDKIRDITVESPSPDFILLRDSVDVVNLLKNKFFTQKPLPVLDMALITQIKNKLKLADDQIKRCYEIFQYYYTDKNNLEEYRKFRLTVKRKLFKKYQDILSGIESKTERKKELDKIYKDLEKEYDSAVQKIQKYFNSMNE